MGEEDKNHGLLLLLHWRHLHDPNALNHSSTDRLELQYIPVYYSRLSMHFISGNGLEERCTVFFAYLSISIHCLPLQLFSLIEIGDIDIICCCCCFRSSIFLSIFTSAKTDLPWLPRQAQAYASLLIEPVAERPFTETHERRSADQSLKRTTTKPYWRVFLENNSASSSSSSTSLTNQLRAVRV